MVILIDWNPVSHIGPIPINWYGIGYALGFIVGGRLTLRWAPQFAIPKPKVESLLLWILLGTVIGARLYYVAQNDPLTYIARPWTILKIWEGGLAYFGGLLGAIATGFFYTRRAQLPFAMVADLFAPAVPIGSAIGRISCGLDGMDYGTPASLPWGVLYTNPNSYAPVDAVPRHPVQFYELAGDLMIAWALLRLRGKVRSGNLFTVYLILFSVLRFFLFFVRGDVPPVALGLKNGQWTALAILAAALITFFRRGERRAVFQA
jgi:phosphatidylglycerol:prolipoprotein diacylglycerol transferase